ncbi:MAG: betaine/proline/choline family ABC transporter ATP-binding protein [Chloroflexi bacterium]|nr:betaine/proline/choline family ABC transporter ATP-binding protein [Chloroflexota bacterium]
MNSTNGTTVSTSPETTDPIISVRSLWKVFGKNPERALEEPYRDQSRSEVQQALDLVVALRDVSFDVSRGETFVVMGLSGSGKSTLVRCLISLIQATSGEISVDGESVTQFDDEQLREFRRSKMAMVFQNFGLLPHKNVLDNAAYGLEIRGVGKAERYAVAKDMLDKVGLTGWENAHQRELSGGMQQRVGLARALAMDPAILLMDEPFSGLDPLIRRQMRDELATLQKEIQKTIIFITHDLDEAITVGDRIAIMRDGEIIQLGTPEEIITKPADDFVREFTQGIPKTRVMTVGHIVSNPEIITYMTESREDLRTRMDDVGCVHAIALNNEGTFVGVISRKLLDEPASATSNGVREAIELSIEPVLPSTSVEQLFQLLSEEDIPVPVVDEHNKCIGIATQKDLLKVVASGL